MTAVRIPSTPQAGPWTRRGPRGEAWMYGSAVVAMKTYNRTERWRYQLYRLTLRVAAKVRP